MKFQVEWSRPVKLRDGTDQGLIYDLPLEKLSTKAGIYIFGRRRGNQFEALYVGKANRIRSRVRGQLNNLRLMQHLKNAKTGKRIILTGCIITKPGQSLDKRLPLVEKALIRYFFSEGHDLVNKLGTRLRRHELESSGKHPKRFFPRVIFVEKGKGE